MPDFVREEADGAFFTLEEAAAEAATFQAQGRQTKIEENWLTGLWTLYVQRLEGPAHG